MSLPKTKYPLFETQLPSNGKTVTFRQMLVRDEKVLLMAKASEDENDVYRSVKQVVNNCMFDQNIDSLTTFDIEWMFLRIRAASIGNVVELTFLDKEDEKEYNFNVDLDEITVSLPEYEEGQGNLVKVTDDLGLSLRGILRHLYSMRIRLLGRTHTSISRLGVSIKSSMEMRPISQTTALRKSF
jgi:hypothetical protein